MSNAGRWIKTALDSQVLRFAAPAYALPVASVGAGALGAGILAGTWPWLLGSAVALHVLLALNLASRRTDGDSTASLPATADAAQRQQALEEGFARIKSAEGVKATQDLMYEYGHLQPLMARRKLTDSLAVGQIPALAEETYKQGLSVLQDAFDLMEASSAEDKDRLEDENGQIQNEITTLQGDPAQAARVRVRKERLASNMELLQIMNGQQARVDELLYQSDRCGASLHRTRMELAALRADGSEEGVNAVIDTLRLTISHARGVQDEMRKLGAQPSA
jgi:hypothetical protein